MGTAPRSVLPARGRRLDARRARAQPLNATHAQPSLPTRRQLRGALIASLALGALAVLASSAVVREQADLEVYWTAASRAADAEPLYRTADGHYQFKYLPAFAVLAAPFGAVAWPAAKIGWFVVSAMLLAWLVTLSIGTLPVQRKPTWLLVAATAVVMGKFFGHELVLGQVNVLFAVVVIAAILLLRARREAAAGACMALAIVIKPYAVLFLPWLLARQRAPSILAALSGVVIALLLPVPLYGVTGTFDLHVEWWRTVTASTEPNLTNNDNVSIAALFAKWLGIGAVAAGLAGFTSLALLAGLVWVFRRRSGLTFPEGLEGALLLTAIPLLSPQGWDYVLLISTPAVMHLVNHEDALPRWLRALALVSLAVIGLSLFDVMGRAAYSAFMALSIITLCYGVVIAALVVLRSRGAA